MEAPKRFSIGRTIARVVVAVASFGLFAVLSPVSAFNYGVGLYGAGLYNVGELASTTTVLASGTNPSTYGNAITLTATVTPSSATGSITFKDGSTTIGTATLGHGSGSLAIATLGGGSRSLTAIYSGNSSYATSISNTLTQTVNRASTSTTIITSSANPSTEGDTITLTATVTPSAVTGSLVFKDGSTTIGTATLGHGSGSLAISSLIAGSHSLTAMYAGNSNYSTSTGSTLTQTVNALPSSSSSESAQTVTGGESVQGHGGGRGGTAAQAKKVAAARAAILARFQEQLAAARSATSSSAPAKPVVQGSPELAPGGKAVASSPTSLSSIAERRGLLLASVGTQSVLYRDVPVAAWYAPYVASLVEEGVAQGYKDQDGNLTGEFGVGKPITYAEVLKMAIETAGTKLKGGSPRNVSAQSTWASSYVKEAEDEHFAAFIPTLDVNTPATRGAVIQTILEAMGIPTGAKVPSPFTDVAPSNPYSPAITVAAVYGLIEGDTDVQGNLLNRFRPNEPMNRAEVAKIIAIARKVMGPAQ